MLVSLGELQAVKTGEGSKGKSLQGLVTHGTEFGFYVKNIRDLLRVLRNLENRLKEETKLEAALAMRGDGSQNQEGSEIERRGQGQEKLRGIFNGTC